MTASEEALQVTLSSRQYTMGAREGVLRIFARLLSHAGLVVAGNIGSARRLNYTVLGDAVNGPGRAQDTVARLYQARYKQRLARPPAANRDAVDTLTEK